MLSGLPSAAVHTTAHLYSQILSKAFDVSSMSCGGSPPTALSCLCLTAELQLLTQGFPTWG